jgi:hypothetical protein
VGLKPSANQGKARLRGLYRIIYSKTISPRLWNAKPACAGESGLFLQRLYVLTNEIYRLLNSRRSSLTDGGTARALPALRSDVVSETRLLGGSTHLDVHCVS